MPPRSLASFARLALACLSLAASALAQENAPDANPRLLEAEDSGASALSFSPDGKRLVTGSHYNDRTYLWDLATGKPIATLEGAGDLVHSAEFSRDGKAIVTAGLNVDASKWVLTVWDGTTGRKTGALEENLGWYAVFSPDKKTLAVARLGRSVAFFQLPKFTPGATFDAGVEDGVDAVAYSPDGKTLATRHKQEVRLWDVRSGRPKAAIPSASRIEQIDFTPDSKQVLACTEAGKVGAWNAANGKAVWERSIGQQEARDVAAAEGYVATLGIDENVFVLDPQTGEPFGTLPLVRGSGEGVAISPDGKTLAVGHSGGVALWTLDPKAPAKSIEAIKKRLEAAEDSPGESSDAAAAE